jgi:hypothetical protein
MGGAAYARQVSLGNEEEGAVSRDQITLLPDRQQFLREQTGTAKHPGRTRTADALGPVPAEELRIRQASRPR